MRLKLAVSREAKHTDAVSAIGWANSEELISCSDDHQMLKWNGVSGDVASVVTLPDTLYPTDIHWYPRVAQASGKKSTSSGAEMFVLTSTDGKNHYFVVLHLPIT